MKNDAIILYTDFKTVILLTSSFNLTKNLKKTLFACYYYYIILYYVLLYSYNYLLFALFVRK